MNELLFECYHVPQAAFGIDSLYSLYYNQPMQGKIPNSKKDFKPFQVKESTQQLIRVTSFFDPHSQLASEYPLLFQGCYLSRSHMQSYV